jgi:hypothetical protein
MPGAYANAMVTELRNGGFPPNLLSIMLNVLDVQRNYGTVPPQVDYDTVTNLGLVSSCHPDAAKFMNIISDAQYPDDIAPNTQMVTGGAARTAADLAIQAAGQDNHAIWIKYGSADGHSHSTMLFTGQNSVVEHFEAWALDGGGYPIHLSIAEEPDELGGDRDYGRCTRAEAQVAIDRLVSDDPDERAEGWDRLSRSGRGYAPGLGEVTHINIHIEDQTALAAFSQEVKRRLYLSGYYRSRIVSQVRRVEVCCRCQSETWPWVVAYFKSWRKCGGANGGCLRRYCGVCRHRLIANACDCGQATAWI